ncbi:DJ-1/PfpI family protein [Streptococcus sp. IsoGale021]|uniref:DJ-1/PfpI family protein n=1 Tax=Streptococcus TaxID=1301 RepID=UPI000D03F047|nr:MULTISPECIES: DJ-1/PfpI family protein [Streptococcus]MCY7210381.1 DJ-1/PfpI family protein [Streptococcus anginosus]MCY7211189.1 DJ-1/PfpI family protein [Streptococcus anginosus]MCY7227384.1 DJ-1/PfpI family protein [Streptococcus anginosus]MDQ8694414.1 DJ-1/PfpI family protein [Streptococcus sp. IsoGale021]MDU5127769.1 DJ-1/PfpI family protein [Streptococcus anginosus]
MKIAILLYPACSLQEITTLTSTLCLSFGQSLDYLASEKKVYTSEEGLQVIPDFTFAEVQNVKYDCIILPGTLEPFVSLYDSRLISFLERVDTKRTIVAAISSSPMFLGKAGLLRSRYYTGGLYMELVEYFSFLEKENFLHQPVVKDKNVITAIGFAYVEFSQTVLDALGLEVPSDFFLRKNSYTPEELTYHLETTDYQEILQEILRYEQKFQK